MIRLYTTDGELLFSTFEELKEYFDKLEELRKRGKRKKGPHMWGIIEGPVKVLFD